VGGVIVATGHPEGMTTTRWLVTLYSIAGGCAAVAAMLAFVDIGRAAKKVKALKDIPGDEFYRHAIDTKFGTEPSQYQMMQVPQILMYLLGSPRQRYLLGALVAVGIVAGTAADILASVQ